MVVLVAFFENSCCITMEILAVFKFREKGFAEIYLLIKFLKVPIFWALNMSKTLIHNVQFL